MALGGVLAAPSPRGLGNEEADAAQLAAFDLAEQGLDRERVRQAEAEGVVGLPAVVDDRVGGSPGGEQGQAQGVQRRDLLEHHGRKLPAQETDDIGLGAQVLDVGHATGGDAAVVRDHQLQGASAEHSTVGVEVFDRGSGAEEDGVVGGAVGVHELRIHPDQHRCRAAEGPPGQCVGEQAGGAGVQEVTAAPGRKAHRPVSAAARRSTVSIS